MPDGIMQTRHLFQSAPHPTKATLTDVKGLHHVCQTGEDAFLKHLPQYLREGYRAVVGHIVSRPFFKERMDASYRPRPGANSPFPHRLEELKDRTGQD
jgi:hypothetical protein